MSINPTDLNLLDPHSRSQASVPACESVSGLICSAQLTNFLAGLQTLGSYHWQREIDIDFH